PIARRGGRDDDVVGAFEKRLAPEARIVLGGETDDGDGAARGSQPAERIDGSGEAQVDEDRVEPPRGQAFEGLSQALNVMHGERGVGTGLERREHGARCGFVLDEQNTEWRSFVYAYWCGARDLTVRIGEHVGGSPGGCSHSALSS